MRLIKDSWDIALHEHAEWSDAQQMLNDAALIGFKRYLRRYAHIALATSACRCSDLKAAHLSLSMPRDLDRRATIFSNSGSDDLFRPGTINWRNISRTEGRLSVLALRAAPEPRRSGRVAAPCRSVDHLSNDGFNEGETEFLYQRRNIVPKTGPLLSIAPTAFTHTHRGNMPKGGDKYIATGWVLFRGAPG